MVSPDRPPHMAVMAEEDLERLSSGREVFVFKGDTTIDGPEYRHAKIEVTGGNLTVHGRLGSDVHILVHGGNVELDSTRENCSISAPRGTIGFEAIGCQNILKAQDISGNYVEMGSQLKASKGDISIETGEHLVRLDAAGDVLFSELGNDGRVKAGSSIQYHRMGENTALDAPSVKQLRQTPPQPQVHAVHYGGRMDIKRLCPLLYHNELLNTYQLNLFQTNRSITAAYNRLYDAIEDSLPAKQEPLTMDHIVYFELPKNPEKAKPIQEAMAHFIAVTNRELGNTQSR